MCSDRRANPSDHCRESDSANVLRFFALAAGSNVELDLLSLGQRLVTVSLNVGVVDENIVTLLT